MEYNTQPMSESSEPNGNEEMNDDDKHDRKCLTKMIDGIYESVNKSCVGPIEVKKADDGVTPIYNNLALQTFLTMIAQICPKGLVTSEIIQIEPREDWKGD